MGSSDESDFVVLAGKDLTDYNDAGYLPQGQETLAEIRAWLSPTKYLSENSEYRRHVNSYLKGTCHWFQNSDAYQEWHDNHGVGALWVKAIAGAGKSVLAATTAARLAEEEQVPVLFFFFRQIVALNHEPKYLVRDWLHQLLAFSPWLQKNLYEKYVKDQKDINTVSLDELWQLICEALSFMPKAYCIADALDEMDNGNEAFLLKLLELGQQKPNSIKVLLTSRPVTRIENVLRSHISQIRLDPADVEDDVDMYVEYRLKPIGGPPTFYETLKPIICTRAQGLFLYARLVMDELVEAVKGIDIAPADIPRIVESVPETLEDVYNKMLLDHSKRSGVSRGHQLTILQWVTHTTRPLRLIEAAAVMQTIGGAGETLKETKSLVRAACGPLLEVLEDETLSVIHHSFTEYLTQTDREPSHFPIITHDETHHLMAITCVKYLCSGPLSEWKIRDPIKRCDYGFYNSNPKHTAEELKLKQPLLEYAISNWYKHARQTSLDGPLLSALSDLFTSGSHNFQAWIDLRIDRNLAKTFTPIHAAAWVGLSGLIRHLAQRGEPADEKGQDGRSPISFAASQGHVDAVVALLALGNVDPNSDDAVGWRPIHYAARANHHKVVRVLLDAGVDPLTWKSREHTGQMCGNAKGSTGETAVEYAVKAGHTETILELIPYLNKETLERALHWAAKGGRSGVVAALVESPDVDIEHKDTDYSWADYSDYGYTAVFQAAMSRDSTTLRILLENGASPIITRLKPFRGLDWGMKIREETVPESLMHPFAGKGRPDHNRPSEDSLREAFKIIVGAGCPIDAVDSEGFTPLHYACGGGGRFMSESCKPIICMLLEAGADASKLTKDGQSVFHLYCGHSAYVIDQFVKHGADINTIATSGRDAGTTALQSLLRNNRSDEMMVRFLEHKPNVNVRNTQGETPLHLVCKSAGHNAEVLKLLLKLGADVNARDDQGQTPMHALSRNTLFHRSDSEARMLIEAGADLDLADYKGRTLLSLALNQTQCKSSIDTVLKLGANIAHRDVEGRSILHLAIHKGNTQILKFLIERGADPKWIDNFGNTLWHEAARLSRNSDEKKGSDFLKSIFSLGVDITKRNHQGYSPLHVAASRASDSWQISDILDFFLDPSNGLDVNQTDNYGVTPLHLAASVCEAHVVALLDAGADPYALTYENQSALHVAARGRQSNVVGLLVQRYQKDGRREFINVRNQQKRTALHDACRSGRPEAVEILLKAGADVGVYDKASRAPLHACAEIMEERAFWRKDTGVAGTRRLDAANVMINDRLRPLPASWNKHSTDEYSLGEEDRLLRTREIVRLLVAHGAKNDVALERCADTPLQFAISRGCELMVQEFLDIDSRKPKEENEDNASANPSAQPAKIWTLHEALYANSCKQITNTLEKTAKHAKAKGDQPSSALHFTKELLNHGHNQAMSDLVRLGWDFIPAENRIKVDESVVHWLAGKGYTDILKQVCTGTTLERSLKCDDIQFAHTMEKENKMPHGSIKPVLAEACKRELPNLPMIKILVDDLGFNINSQVRSHQYHRGEYKDQTNFGPLHYLATADHWWQAEALEFLLQRGAKTEIRDQDGMTPLHVAMEVQRRCRLYKNSTVALLLKYGANANAVDDLGMTCLDHASSSPHLIRLLVDHGANVNGTSRPPLLSAVQKQKLESVSTLIEVGADINAPLYQNKGDPQAIPQYNFQPTQLYPLFAAAFDPKNNVSSASQVYTRIAIVELLLENGADPYRILDNETTIIHHIFSNNRAVSAPFLLLPDLQLEHRDPKGRTLLLAACMKRLEPCTDRGDRESEEDKSMPKAAMIQRLIDRGADVSAIDNEGKGVLHHLLEASKFRKLDESVAMICSKYPELVQVRDKEGYKPLHTALKLSMWASTQVLVDAGADLRDVDPQGNTALHHLSCARSGVIHALFKKALELKVEINTRNDLGQTPLTKFLGYGSYTPGNFPYDEEQAIQESLEILQNIFIANGADIFTTDNEGKGLLHVIAKKKSSGRFDFNTAVEGSESLKTLFKTLVDKGLDPWLEDMGQVTPLDVAAVVGNDAILKMFRKEK